MQGVGLVAAINSQQSTSGSRHSLKSAVSFSTDMKWAVQERGVLRLGATWTETQCLCLQMAFK